MQSILILALTLMGWMGNPNMGRPERLADDHGHIKHHQLSLSVSQNSGGPECLALDSSDRIKHETQLNLGGSNCWKTTLADDSKIR